MLRDEKYRILTLQDKTTSIFALSDGDGDLSDPIWLFLSFSLILALSLALSRSLILALSCAHQLTRYLLGS